MDPLLQQLALATETEISTALWAHAAWERLHFLL